MPLDQTQDIAQRGVVAQALESAWHRLRQALGAAQQSEQKLAAEVPDVLPRGALDTTPEYREVASEQSGQLNRFSGEVTSVTERNEQVRNVERERFDLSLEEQTDIEAWLEAGQEAEGEEWEDDITIVGETEWSTYATGYEYKEYLGQDESGNYYYAVETSFNGGDDCEAGLPWRGPYETIEDAVEECSDAVWKLHNPEQEHEPISQEHDGEEHEL